MILIYQVTELFFEDVEKRTRETLSRSSIVAQLRTRRVYVLIRAGVNNHQLIGRLTLP